MVQGAGSIESGLTGHHPPSGKFGFSNYHFRIIVIQLSQQHPAFRLNQKIPEIKKERTIRMLPRWNEPSTPVSHVFCLDHSEHLFSLLKKVAVFSIPALFQISQYVGQQVFHIPKNRRS
jgi:hypothetical protein